jgi:hypothetical protein
VGKQPLIVALAAFLVAGTARSADPPRAAIDVAFQDCNAEPIGESAFRQALGLELEQGLDQYPPRSNAQGSPPKIEVKFRCDGLALIRIQLETSNILRRVRFDDVPRSERPRALALVVAELYRSGSQGGPPPPDSTVERADAAPGSADELAATEQPAAPSAPPRPLRPLPKIPPSGAPDAGIERHGAGAGARARLRFRGSAALRTSLDARGTHYGGSLGLTLHGFRLGVEGLFSREKRSRGEISSGVAAARVARGIPFVRGSALDLSLTPSAALGVTWAVGHSEVEGTRVRDVLLPYADARVGLLAALHVDATVDLELELYAGRAAGILARADAEPTQATGGWFAGAEAGLSF